MNKIISGLLLFLFSSYVLTSELEIEEVTDLQHLGHEMSEKELVLVLEFHAENCAFCYQLEEEILKPMLISGDYDDLVRIQKLKLDSDRKIKNFDGSITSGAKLGDKLNVFVTPTLVFLDSAGNEVSERIVGINTPEMFGAYVDAAIEEAQANIHK